MAKGRPRNRKKDKTGKKAAKSPVNQKLIAGVLIALALVGGIYLFNQSKNKGAENSGTVANVSGTSGPYGVLNQPSTHEPGKVKIIEFISFYCGHCYQFNGMKPALEDKYGDRLKIETRPIVWGAQSMKSVEAYIIAEQLGKGSQMGDALFNANFVDKRDIGDEKVLIKLADDIGLGSDFVLKLKSGDAKPLAEENIRLAGVYGVEETPTLIVDGNIKITPHETGDDVVKMAKSLDKMIGEILEQ